MKRLAPALLTLLAIAAPSYGWGEKGHALCSEAATFSVPNDMPLFFYKAYPDLVYLGYDPDRWRGAGESLDAVNPPDHFLDFEFVEDLGPLPSNRYRYLHLLETSRTLRRHGILNSTAGFLPWRIAEMADLLTREFRIWRAAPEGSPERKLAEADIIHVAGVLGHYTADAANPHHATFNFNGWVLPNPNGYATDCDTHFRFETWFVDHAVTLAAVAPQVPGPVLRTDYFAAAMDAIRESNSLVGTLYRLDRDHAFAYPPASPAGTEFATRRLAAGAALTRDLWWSAWRNSEQPPKRRQPVPED
jgi:hypothetical protein